MTEAKIAEIVFAEVQKNQSNSGFFMAIILIGGFFIIKILWEAYRDREKKSDSKEAAVVNIHELKKMFREIALENTLSPDEEKARSDTRVQVAVIQTKQSHIDKKVDGLCEDMANVSSSVSHVTNKVDLACKDIHEIKETIKQLKEAA